MPNRILRDWTDSEKINDLSVHAERFFTRLIMVVDDYGCFTANLKMLRSNLFPLLVDQVREADITRWMTECQMAGIIVLYIVDKKSFIQIVDFKQRLRTAKSKYPFPNDGHVSDIGRPETKRNETYTDDEDETNSPPSPTIECPEFHQGQKYFDMNHTGRENFDDISPGEMLIPSAIKNCHALYLNSKYFAPTREEVAMRHYIDEELLSDWVGVFVVNLTRQGHLTKTLKDFAVHFSNWLPKQDLKKTPKQALEYEQRNSKNTKPGSGDKRGEAHAAINKLFGQSG